MSDNTAPIPPPAAPHAPPAQAPAISTTGVIVITIAALYFGREILIPLALAILLGFILTPPMLWLRRRGVPRIAAAILVVLIALSVIGGIATAVGLQLVQLAENLPSYQRNIKQKLASLRGPGSGFVDRVTDTLKDLGSELSKPEEAKPTVGPVTTGPPARREPVPVVMEPGPLQPLEVMQTVLGPLLGPLGTAALVVLFLIFILFEREELRDRFIKLVSGGDLQRSTEAITEAAGRVSRYLLMQLFVNVTYGIPIGIGLYLIGVPNAVLWGVLAAVLRFIPYLGPWLAALFPLTIAFGVDPGWSMLLWTIALFVVIELISNNAIEPWLYGSSTGLSSFAVVLAAIFWTLLWGPVGLFLATPLTVCLVVIGRYVPRLEFLGVLLGSSPVLSPAERLYQRLLSGNVDEAIEIAENYVDQSSSLAFYDEVAIPALRLAENDRQRSADVEFRRSIADGIVEVVGEVEDHVRQSGEGPESRAGTITEEERAHPRVLCIGGRTELDLAAAEVITCRLVELGVGARPIAPISVSRTAIEQLDLSGIEVVCLSYFQAKPEVLARHVYRRLERRAPHLAMIVCCWNFYQDREKTSALAAQLGAKAEVVTSVAATEQSILSALAVPCGDEPEAVLLQESEYLDRLRELGLATGKGPDFERLASRVAETLGTSIMFIALVEEACVNGTMRCRVDENSAEPPALSQLICAEVVAAAGTVVVEDVAEDPRFAPNEELLEKGIRFFAAAPLLAPSGFVLGALCVLGSKRRSLSDAEKLELEALAADIVGLATRSA